MDIDEGTEQGQEYLEAVQGETLDSLGYFLKPSELFSEMARRGNGGGKAKFILDDLTKVLTSIAQSTMGTVRKILTTFLRILTLPPVNSGNQKRIRMS